MPQLLTPGVYIQEVPGQKPIEGVGTATGAFVGIAEKGPIGEARLITNLTQFTNTFGGFIEDGYLAEAVTQFFSEGGTRCYVVRTCHYSDPKIPETALAVASSAPPLTDRATTPVPTLEIEAESPGEWGDKITIEIDDAKKDPDNKFKLTVKYDDIGVESFDELSMTDTDPDHYVETKINGVSKYIRVLDLDSKTEAPNDRPAKGSLPLAGGNNGLKVPDPTPDDPDNLKLVLNDKDFLGSEAAKNGLHAFDTVDDINILAIPDSAALLTKELLKGIIIDAYKYCEDRKDCFFIADPPWNLDTQEIFDFKMGTTTDPAALNSSYAALYYPWLKPLTRGKTYVPPSGAIVGVYSATDVRRGVHKSPAGVVDGNLKSAVGLERLITHGEQESLNPEGINVIRFFPGAGITVWGARTLSVDPEWKYINIRRLFLFLEESIEEATQWVVFEPNSRSLWQTVKRDVTAFLTIVWRSGALFGSTEEEAFFVKIDDENNPPEVRDLGQLIIDVGVAPVKPAEFVVFRISQKTLEA